MSQNNEDINIIVNAVSNGFTSNMSKINKSVTSSVSNISSLTKSVVGLGLAYAGITSLKTFSENVIKTRMEYEKMEAALSASVGAQNADSVFKSLQQFTKETPFQLDQVTTAYQRLLNLGLKPTKEAMLAYGNISAGIPNKSIIDFVEAVADAVTGENERLKEFGIRASKSGDMVSYTFQGVTKTMKATKENIEEYLISVGKSFANGKALENQAVTMSGRLNALSDTYSQLSNNLAKSSGSAKLFGDGINAVTVKVQDLNDVFESDAITNYVQIFKTNLEPVINLFKDLKEESKDTAFAQFFETPSEKITATLNQLSDLYDKFLDFVSLIDGMLKNDTFGAVFDLADESLTPLYETFKDFNDFLTNEFTESWKTLSKEIEEIWGSMPSVIKEPVDQAINFMKLLFSGEDNDLNGVNLFNNIRENYSKFPAYVKKMLYDAIAEFKYFKDVTIGYVSAVVEAVRNFSSESGSKLLNESLTQAQSVYKNKLKENQDTYISSTKKIEEANKKMKKSFDDAQKSASASRLAQIKKIEDEKNAAQKKLEELKKKNDENKGKDIAGDIGKQIVANQQKNASSDPTPPSAASARSAEAAHRKMLKDQEQFVNDINNFKTELLSLQNTNMIDVQMAEFERKYGELQKRIASDKNGNYSHLLPDIDKMRGIVKANAEISESQRKLNLLQAEYETKIAETNYSVEAGKVSYSKAKKEEIDLTKKLYKERVKFLENELMIASKTDGFSQLQILQMRKQLAEFKKSDVEINSWSKNLSDNISGAFTGLFDNVLDNTKSFSETFKYFLEDISRSIVAVLTKGWQDDLIDSISNVSKSVLGSAGGGSAGGLGGFFKDMFGGFFATGGVMKPNTFNVVGENGPELVYNGARPTSVMNNGAYNNLSKEAGQTYINMNITTKDANSMRLSQKQIMYQTQQEVMRQTRRNM